MEYTLTQHALDVIKEREIPIEWIERVLKAPTLTEPDQKDNALEHRLGLISEYSNRVLRVIVNTWVDPIRVITVYFDRDMKGEL